MKRSSGPRRTARLSDSLHQQLSMYALAAGAAGVGVLAMSHQAEAKIVYRPVHQVISPKHTYPLDLNHDGIVDFAIQNYILQDSSFLHDRLYAIPFNKNGVAGTQVYAYALPRGAVIGTKKKFSAQMMMSYVYPFACFAPWCSATDRYLGLMFHANGQVHYGWARLSVALIKTKHEVTVTLTGYAYETIPNKPIIAGRTKGADESNVELPDAALTSPIPDQPQPASLGALAMGAPGLSIWRREESAAVGSY